MATIEDLEEAFANHPSITSSFQDYEITDNNNKFLNHHARIKHNSPFTHSSNHSGFRSEAESDLVESLSAGQYSPPAWRRDDCGNRSSGFWNLTPVMRHQTHQSRESSPDLGMVDFAEDETLAAAARTRLPSGSMSPEKRRSVSPDLPPLAEKDLRKAFAKLQKLKDQVEEHPSLPQLQSQNKTHLGTQENQENYIRFAVRAEVQHKSELLNGGISYLKAKFESMTSSWLVMMTSISVALISILAVRSLFQPGSSSPAPDLVKVAGLAKAFEPLIFYSENGIRQVGDLQATGIAVWDLGESVRSTNMTSAPIIVKELDKLSDSLKSLAVELTRFFANVDGDIDGILLVMDWARRELSQLHLNSPSSFTFAFDNMHTLLRRCGLLESSAGIPTRLGLMTSSIFGLTTQQRTEAILQKTFHEFISVLEEAINSELNHSLALLSLFSAVDNRYLNLARIVARESKAQESAQEESLSSLWSMILGPNSNMLHKFEKNMKLLNNIRAMTLQNKGLLEEHNRKLLTLKANLENLRRKLISPLLQQNASTIGVAEQIRGLQEVSGYLGGVREKQRSKLMEMVYGSGRDTGRSTTARLDTNHNDQ